MNVICWWHWSRVSSKYVHLGNDSIIIVDFEDYVVFIVEELSHQDCNLPESVAGFAAALANLQSKFATAMP